MHLHKCGRRGTKNPNQPTPRQSHHDRPILQSTAMSVIFLRGSRRYSEPVCAVVELRRTCSEMRNTIQRCCSVGSPQPTPPAVFDAYFGVHVAISHQDTDTKDPDSSTTNLSNPESDLSQLLSNDKGNPECKHLASTSQSACNLSTSNPAPAQHNNLFNEANNNAAWENFNSKPAMPSDLLFLGHMILDPNSQEPDLRIF